LFSKARSWKKVKGIVFRHKTTETGHGKLFTTKGGMGDVLSFVRR